MSTPVSEHSRSKMPNTLYESLARIRRDEGVDPKRYPPIEADIQYDIQQTMCGADLAAQKASALLLPAILNGRAPGWRHRFAATLRHPLLAAAVVITSIALCARYYSQEFNANVDAQREATLQDAKSQADMVCNRLSELSAFGKQIESLRKLQSEESARRPFDELISRAILSKSPNIKTTLGDKYVTIVIPEKLLNRSGNQASFKVEHGLSPQEFKALCDQYKAAKNATFEK
ncbi:MAG: hypothetical protein WCP35_19715 [Verrucomicrobiota bacterium]